MTECLRRQLPPQLQAPGISSKRSQFRFVLASEYPEVCAMHDKAVQRRERIAMALLAALTALWIWTLVHGLIWLSTLF